MRLPIRNSSPEPRKIRQAASCIRQGEIVAIPSETEYLYVANALAHRALLALYELVEQSRRKKDKKTHSSTPTLLVSGMTELAHYAVLSDPAFRFLRGYGSSPLEALYYPTAHVPRYLRPKRNTLNIRIPIHEVPQSLLSELGEALVTLRAPDGPDAEPLRKHKQLALILDAGPIPNCCLPALVDLRGDEVIWVREE